MKNYQKINTYKYVQFKYKIIDYNINIKKYSYKIAKRKVKKN